MKYRRSVYQSMTLVMQFGINMLVPIFLCLFLGKFIGDQLSMPALTIPFFLLGAAAGFRNIYVLAMKIVSDDEKRKKMEKEQEREKARAQHDKKDE